MPGPGSFEIFIILSYVIIPIVVLFICRWIFAIDKRVKQQESMINLLKLLASKQGATDDEIHSVIKK